MRAGDAVLVPLKFDCRQKRAGDVKVNIYKFLLFFTFAGCLAHVCETRLSYVRGCLWGQRLDRRQFLLLFSFSHELLRERGVSGITVSTVKGNGENACALAPF